MPVGFSSGTRRHRSAACGLRRHRLRVLLQPGLLANAITNLRAFMGYPPKYAETLFPSSIKFGLPSRHVHFCLDCNGRTTSTPFVRISFACFSEGTNLRLDSGLPMGRGGRRLENQGRKAPSSLWVGQKTKNAHCQHNRPKLERSLSTGEINSPSLCSTMVLVALIHSTPPNTPT